MNDLSSKDILKNLGNVNRSLGYEELVSYYVFLEKICGERNDEVDLYDKANVSVKVRKVINDGFSTIHPFMYLSKHLENFLHIINDIKSLQDIDYNYCIDAIHNLVMRNIICQRCHGKGLVYLKLLTKDRDENRYNKYVIIYVTFSSFDKFDIDYEKDVKCLIEKYRIII
jgi:hypothetical protein